MRSARTGQASTHIDATPEQVWAIVSDLERMGEWSPECYRVEWLDGATSPAKPGARFKGWNRYGLMRWSMTCEVKTADPGREISWATVKGARELVVWAYRLQPASQGCELTESFEVQWLPPTAVLAEDFLMRDRDRRRDEAMRSTLARIKKAAESSVTGSVASSS
ncbi:MAG TPA: SRPBCC family protein [Acidimicrobiales bacterium]|nr:SRPBCC family protein [Acidimicrobiales bacterium]